MPHQNNNNNNNNSSSSFSRSNMPQGHQENIMDQGVPPLEQEALSNPDRRTYRQDNNSYNLNVPATNVNLWPSSSRNTLSFSSNDNSGSTPPEPIAESPTDLDNACELQALAERALSIQGGGQVVQNMGDQAPIGPFNIAQEQFYPPAPLQTPADPGQYQGRQGQAGPPQQVLHRQLHPYRIPRVPEEGQHNSWLCRYHPAVVSNIPDAFFIPPQNGAAQPNRAAQPNSPSGHLDAGANPWAAQRVQQPPPARASDTCSRFVGSTAGGSAPVPQAPVSHSTRHTVHDGSNMTYDAPQFHTRESSNIQPNTGALMSNTAQRPPNGPSIALSNAPQHSVKGATIHPERQGVFLQSNAGLSVPSTGGPVRPACGGVGVQANGGISPSQVTGCMVSAGSGIVIPLEGQPGSSSGVPANTAPRPAATGFRPMTAVHQPRGVNMHDDPQRDLKLASGISLNYAGDASIPRNQSADIPDHLNCAMWIRNLPPNVTYNSLLGSIRGMGRVYATHINPPDEAKGHKTAAAKLVFFDLDAAQRFYSMASNPARRFIVQGMVAVVQHNRIKSEACDPGGNLSRALNIKGHPSFVNRRSLLGWFGEFFQYNLDEVVTIMHNEEMGEVRVLFGSYRSQAQAAYMALVRSHPPGQPGSLVWSVRYDHDPCA